MSLFFFINALFVRQGLYCDVRQLMNYVKETSGSTFRRVALSGLIDAIDKNPPNKDKPRTTKIVRSVSITCLVPLLVGERLEYKQFLAKDKNSNSL